jgi:hypothetical protein
MIKYAKFNLLKTHDFFWFLDLFTERLFTSRGTGSAEHTSGNAALRKREYTVNRKTNH